MYTSAKTPDYSYAQRFTEFIAALFILLFVYTSLSKLLNFTNFRIFLERSPIVGKIATVLAVFLPSLEIGIAGLLFVPKTRLIGLYGALALMISFTTYLGAMLLLNTKLPCSCGGIIKDLSWTQHLLLNIFFVLLAVVGIAIKTGARLPRFDKKYKQENKDHL